MINSVDTEKASDEIQYTYVKNIQMRNRKELPHLQKSIYETLASNIIHNGERMHAFSLRSGPRQGCPFLSLLFSIILDVVARAIRQGKQLKDTSR